MRLSGGIWEQTQVCAGIGGLLQEQMKTLNLIEKNKLLTKIKDKLRRQNLQIKDEMLKIKISQLLRHKRLQHC